MEPPETGEKSVKIQFVYNFVPKYRLKIEDSARVAGKSTLTSSAKKFRQLCDHASYNKCHVKYSGTKTRFYPMHLCELFHTLQETSRELL